MNRRQALAAIGVGGVTACAATAAQAADDKSKVVYVGEKPTLFKLKDVTLDALDGQRRTVALSFGPADARIKLTGLPLAKDVSIRQWFEQISIANNMPFTMGRLKESVGKVVSSQLRAEASGLVLAAIATAND